MKEAEDFALLLLFELLRKQASFMDASKNKNPESEIRLFFSERFIFSSFTYIIV